MYGKEYFYNINKIPKHFNHDHLNKFSKLGLKINIISLRIATLPVMVHRKKYIS